MIYNGSINRSIIYNGVFIPITYQKQVIKKVHDFHQGINAVKNLVQKSAGWPFVDSDIEQFVNDVPTVPTNHRPRLTDSTDKWEESAPWERLAL